uniref:Uncharacterized protein n=1 Tax=Vespula pensylvanica TaxID=30213 RepID=A0A834U9P4_VESPE|nr:hypothetical protein H0235_009067 [Vespula pensylvanica]
MIGNARALRKIDPDSKEPLGFQFHLEESPSSLASIEMRDERNSTSALYAQGRSGSIFIILILDGQGETQSSSFSAYAWSNFRVNYSSTNEYPRNGGLVREAGLIKRIALVKRTFDLRPRTGPIAATAAKALPLKHETFSRTENALLRISSNTMELLSSDKTCPRTMFNLFCFVLFFVGAVSAGGTLEKLHEGASRQAIEFSSLLSLYRCDLRLRLVAVHDLVEDEREIVDALRKYSNETSRDNGINGAQSKSGTLYPRPPLIAGDMPFSVPLFVLKLRNHETFWLVATSSNSFRLS